MLKNFNFIDLFSGIGGFHLALKEFGGEVVLASDIDTHANQIYKENFNFDSHYNIYNINQKIINKLPKIDVITAGFPCQTFSNAGNKKGFNEERGKLIFQVEKLIKLLPSPPKIIILENVKHLATHENGETLRVIKSLFTKLNYLTSKEPIIISPHLLGIPQHRPRIIIPLIYSKKTNNTSEIFDQLKKIQIFNNTNSINVDKYLEKKPVHEDYFISDSLQLKIFSAWEEFVKKVKRPNSRTLPVIWIEEFQKEDDYSHFSKWKQKYIKDIRAVYKTNKKFIDNWLIKWDVKSWKKRDKKLEWQAGINNYEFKNSFIQLRQSGIRCRAPKMFPTLVAMVQIPILFCKKLQKWRYLTVREVANIQNFPLNFKMHNSKWHAYKQFGNAVNVKVIKHVFKKIKMFLD